MSFVKNELVHKQIGFALKSVVFSAFGMFVTCFVFCVLCRSFLMFFILFSRFCMRLCVLVLFHQFLCVLAVFKKSACFRHWFLGWFVVLNAVVEDFIQTMCRPASFI